MVVASSEIGAHIRYVLTAVASRLIEFPERGQQSSNFLQSVLEILEISYESFVHPGNVRFSREGFRDFIRDVDVLTGRSLLSLMEASKVEDLVRSTFLASFSGGSTAVSG